MVAAVEFERRVTGAGILGVIVRELSHWWRPGPVILFKVDEGLEVGLHGAVLPLCLTISLQVKRGGEPTLNAEEVAKQ